MNSALSRAHLCSDFPSELNGGEGFLSSGTAWKELCKRCLGEEAPDESQNGIGGAGEAVSGSMMVPISHCIDLVR